MRAFSCSHWTEEVGHDITKFCDAAHLSITVHLAVHFAIGLRSNKPSSLVLCLLLEIVLHWCRNCFFPVSPNKISVNFAIVHYLERIQIAILGTWVLFAVSLTMKQVASKLAFHSHCNIIGTQLNYTNPTHFDIMSYLLLSGHWILKQETYYFSSL